MKIAIYYTLVFIVSFILNDLNNTLVFQWSGINVYVVDLLYGLLLYVVFEVIRSRSLKGVLLEGKIYVLFLLWLGLEVLIGIPSYGYRAVGESRFVLPFLAFFVPFALFGGNRPVNQDLIAKVVVRTIVVAGVAGVLMLAIELINGGRFFLNHATAANFSHFEDFRGVRYLDTYHTFNILLLAWSFFFLWGFTGKTSLAKSLWVAVLILAALLSRNRAAIFASCASGIVLILVMQKWRLLVFFGVLAVLVLSLIQVSMPETAESVEYSILSGLNPSEDQTGNWRLLQFGSALEQGLETPLLGQGFGGYYYLNVPGMRAIEEIPHNQFILLFLKTGVIGMLLCLAFIFALALRYIRVLAFLRASPVFASSFTAIVLVILSQVLYGLAYPFVPLFGLYAGFAVLAIRSLPKANEAPISSVVT